MCRCAEPRRPVSGVREALRMPRDRSADAVNAATVTPCRAPRTLNLAWQCRGRHGTRSKRVDRARDGT